MPYINQTQREALKGRKPNNVGEVNYVITTAVDEYIADYGLSYERINAMIGVLECAKLELYRRIAAPYENGKIADHGDVYSC